MLHCFQKSRIFLGQEVQMILAEGFQYLQGLLTGDLNEADICHKYHQQCFLCRIRLLTQGWAGIAVPGHFREYWPPTSVPKSRNGIFHSHSVPENWEGNFPLAFPKIGNGIPVTKIRNGIFHLHSRSRSQEWNFPLAFQFAKIGNDIFHSHSHSPNLEWNWSFPFQFPKSKSHSHPPLV